MNTLAQHSHHNMPRDCAISSRHCVVRIIISLAFVTAFLWCSVLWPISVLAWPYGFIAVCFIATILIAWPMRLGVIKAVTQFCLRICRPPYRLSLKTLLIGVFFLSVLLTPLSWKAQQVRDQKRIVSEIQGLPATVLYDVGYDRNNGTFGTHSIAPNWLRQILGDDFVAPVTAVFIGASVTDHQNCMTVCRLVNDVSDEDIPYLISLCKQLPDLTLIDVQGTNITGKGVEKLDEALSYVKVNILPP